MSEWQPIESAPKDGTKVLLYCTTDAMPDDDVYKLMEADDFIEYEVACWDEQMGEWFTRYCAPPTHWMPLPPPPAEGGEK